MYTTAEIVKILSPYKDKSPIKVKLMDEILTKKLVPAGRTQLFVLLKDHKEGGAGKLLTMIGTRVVSQDCLKIKISQNFWMYLKKKVAKQLEIMNYFKL